MTIYKVTWIIIKSSESTYSLTPYFVDRGERLFKSKESAEIFLKELKQAAALVNQTVSPELSSVVLEEA